MSPRINHGSVSPSRTQKSAPRATAVIEQAAGSADVFASSAVWRAVMAAAQDVCAEWPHTEHGATSAADVRITVTALTENVRQACNGDSITFSTLPPFVPVRRALELLRRAFLERAESSDIAGAADAGSVLDVIKAMERVQDALDDDAAHRFAARLSGEDAQQLVVEMAHDMRSPLGSILILAERLRYGSGGTLTPIQERQLGLVYSAAFGLSALAGDVIELARGGTTLMDQPPMPFLVSDVLQSIMDILRPMAEVPRRLVGVAEDERELGDDAVPPRALGHLEDLVGGRPLVHPLQHRVRPRLRSAEHHRQAGALQRPPRVVGEAHERVDARLAPPPQA